MKNMDKATSQVGRQAPILNYDPGTPPPTLLDRCATSCMRISFALLVVEILATHLVIFTIPRKPWYPWATVCIEISNILAVCISLGLAFAVVGGLLRNFWSWMAVLGHAMAFIMQPSIGFA